MKIRVKVTGPVVNWNEIEVSILGRYAPVLKAMAAGESMSEVREIACQNGVCFGDVEDQISIIWNILAQCNPRCAYQPVDTNNLSTLMVAAFPDGRAFTTRSIHRLEIAFAD